VSFYEVAQKKGNGELNLIGQPKAQLWLKKLHLSELLEKRLLKIWAE
jgi:hypothetical protein